MEWSTVQPSSLPCKHLSPHLPRLETLPMSHLDTSDHELYKIQTPVATHLYLLKNYIILFCKMRGSDILFFQCRVKNCTHLAHGSQVRSPEAALSTPALVCQVTYTHWLWQLPSVTAVLVRRQHRWASIIFQKRGCFSPILLNVIFIHLLQSFYLS